MTSRHKMKLESLEKPVKRMVTVYRSNTVPGRFWASTCFFSGKISLWADGYLKTKTDRSAAGWPLKDGSRHRPSTLCSPLLARLFNPLRGELME